MAILEVIAVFAIVVTITVVTLLVVDHVERQKNRRRQRPHGQHQQGNGPYERPNDNDFDVHNWVPDEPFPDQPDNFPHDLPVQNQNDVIPDDMDIISLDGEVSPSIMSAASGNIHRRRRREAPSSLTSRSSTSSLCCGICLDRLSGERIQETGVQTALCGHPYCRDCLYEWVDGHGACPKCKRPTTREQLHPIYFDF